VADEVQAYERWLNSLELTPTIVALRKRVRDVVLKERQKARPRLEELGPRQEQALDAMCESIVNQLLHTPLTELKRSRDQEDGARLVETVQRLFGLEVGQADATQATDAAEAQSAALSPSRSGRRS
jgi:glutamyl-tRNA reductase